MKRMLLVASSRTAPLSTLLPKSVSGIIYQAASRDETTGGTLTGAENELITKEASFPAVMLFTKANCTLCDNVTAILRSVAHEHPHSLTAVDITDEGKEKIYDM
jgi:hypothetical protein